MINLRGYIVPAKFDLRLGITEYVFISVRKVKELDFSFVPMRTRRRRAK
ncbi:hypothetical protein GCM10027018_19860 [Paenibacillus thermoaerophilus]